MSDTCTIEPVTDDMAMCQPGFQPRNGKLALTDGEDGWFVRVDGITEYGSDPLYERISIHTPEPLMFFNLQGVPRSTCLLLMSTMTCAYVLHPLLRFYLRYCTTRSRILSATSVFFIRGSTVSPSRS